MALLRNVMITGCNRGIGLSLVKQFLNETPASVIATCRNPDGAQELQQLQQSNESRLHILQMDLRNFNEFSGKSNDVEKVTKGQGLNLLINNAGISTKFSRLQNTLKVEQLVENFVINTVAPIMLTKAMLPLLKIAATNNAGHPISIERAAVVNISSVLGSISQNKDGGFYPYRCSKAALNAATQSMSLDFMNDGILAVAIHPGWCKTDMGGKNAPLDVDTATSSILKTLRGLTSEQNGAFIQYDGQSIAY